MRALIAFLILLPISMAVCAQDTKAPLFTSPDLLGPGEVATIDGERIPESVYRLFVIGNFQVNPDDLKPEERTQVIDRLVYLLLLAKEAEKKGLEDERRIATELALQRVQTLATHMAERYAEEHPPTEAELKKMYDDNLPLLEQPKYKVRHILVKTQSEAADLIKQLDKGADFAKLARENSTDSSASDGGSLDWVTADSVAKPFADALQATTPGKYYPKPVQTEFGWHVIKVDEEQDQPAPSMDSIRDKLKEAVDTQHVQEFVKSLRDNADVAVK